jgi:hypothetical protein
MELPVLHIANSRGFSSNVLLIRMRPLSHRRFSDARVVNQRAVHEARSKVATVVHTPSESFLEMRLGPALSYVY